MRILFHLLLCLGVASLATASELAPVRQFVGKYCVSCHNVDDQEGDRSFDELSGVALESEQLEMWHEVLDRLNLADMPPEDAELQPSDDDRLAMVKTLTGLLAEASEQNAASDQTVLRRLNRKEYDTSVRTLLGLEAMLKDPTADFTPDESADHFRNVGEALVLSDVLLTQYLHASRAYLSQAIENAKPTPKPKTRRFEAPFCRTKPNPDGLDRPGQYQHLRENPTDHHGYLWLGKLGKGVPAGGWYTVRVKASAIDRDHPYKDFILDTARQDPLQLAIVATDARATDISTNDPSDRPLHVFEVADDDPDWYEATVWLDEGYTPRFTFPNGPARIKYMRHLLMHNHRDLFPTFIRDHVHVFHSMHPDYDAKTAPAMVKEFLEEQDRLKQAGKPYDVFGIAHRLHTNEAWMTFYSEYRGPRIRVFEVELTGPHVETSQQESQQQEIARRWFPADDILSEGTAHQTIQAFASAAFRYPIESENPATDPRVARFIKLYDDQVSAGADSIDALRMAYQAILCSPAFLYHRTSPGSLDPHELATRLSFFLTSSPPDAALLTLARQGKLSDPDVLRQQTDRLLDDQRNLDMVDAFIGAWLHLDKLGTMLPSRDEHPEYYNDQLEQAMRTETKLFISDMIARDVGVSALIDSDYTFLNAPLARLYDIPDVDGHQFRRVELPNRLRGGLLGQASVLTSTANGIDTSPVLRGVWVLECLLGTPPSPPPPDVEPIEPDTRGAVTIREQLQKHREVATCASCHRRIDPPGFALESFDEIGRFRKRYLLDGAWKRKGPPVDPSGQLPSGESFDDIRQLKQHFLKRLDLVTQNLAAKLLTHATGRIDAPADRAEVLKIMQSVSSQSIVSTGDARDPHGVGMRTLIHAIVQSEAMRR